MPWNGAGSFAPPAASPYPAVGGTTILASQFNSVINDISNNGFGNTITRDGQGIPTANLPMSGFKHINCAVGVAGTDYATMGQVNGVPQWGGLAGGTANALTLTPLPAWTSYPVGASITFKASLTNTGVTTVQVSGLAAPPTAQMNGAALTGGEIVAGRWYRGLLVTAAIVEIEEISSPMLGQVSPAQIIANQNDYNPAGLVTAGLLRLNSNARVNITGLSQPNAGPLLSINNSGTFPIVFTYQDAASLAGNRFAFGCTLGGGQTMTILYDGTLQQWIPVSLPPGPIGQLMDFSGGTVPAGFLACNGSAVSRTTYASLFNEIGTVWGVGDGATTFNVPASARRTWVGSGGVGTATLGNAVGNVGGEETHILTIAEIPAHTHSYNDFSIAALGNLSAGGTQGGGNNTGSTGGGTAHNNIQPSAIVTKIIRYI